MKNLNKWGVVSLVAIGLLFLFTRLYQITKNPPSLYWDEASIGVNAYSILTTGKDEWGTVFPLHFRAFGEFKLPVYIYTVTSFMAVLGKSELAVRLPAVFFTALAFVFSFLIFKKYFDVWYALMGVFFLTVTPWLFLFSRAGYEATAGLALFLGGLFFFLNSIQRLKLSYRSFLIAHLCWGLALFSYNSFRVIIPIALPLFYLYLWSLAIPVKTKVKAICMSLVLVSLLMVPVLKFMLSPDGSRRFREVGAIDLSHKQATIINVTGNYLKNFSPQFLLLNGDSNSRSHTQFGGELLLVEIILIFVGLIQIGRTRSKDDCLFLGLLLISAIPAAITKESPHALRGLTMVPFFVFLALRGTQVLMSTVSWQRFLIVVILLVSIFQFGAVYLDFLQNYSKFAPDWQFGYMQVFKSYNKNFSKYSHVYISDYLAQPYVFYLFYGDIDPKTIREKIQYNPASDWGFSTVRSIGEIVFTKNLDNDLSNSLVFASPEQRLDNVNMPDIIRNPDGSVAFYVYDFTKK